MRSVGTMSSLRPRSVRLRSAGILAFCQSPGRSACIAVHVDANLGATKDDLAYVAIGHEEKAIATALPRAGSQPPHLEDLAAVGVCAQARDGAELHVAIDVRAEVLAEVLLHGRGLLRVGLFAPVPSVSRQVLVRFLREMPRNHRRLDRQ